MASASQRLEHTSHLKILKFFSIRGFSDMRHAFRLKFVSAVQEAEIHGLSLRVDGQRSSRVTRVWRHLQ